MLQIGEEGERHAASDGIIRHDQEGQPSLGDIVEEVLLPDIYQKKASSASFDVAQSPIPTSLGNREDGNLQVSFELFGGILFKIVWTAGWQRSVGVYSSSEQRQLRFSAHPERSPAFQRYARPRSLIHEQQVRELNSRVKIICERAPQWYTRRALTIVLLCRVCAEGLEQQVSTRNLTATSDSTQLDNP